MELLQKLKCAFTSKISLKEFYKTLPREKLRERKAYHFKVFLTITMTWLLSFFLMIWSSIMEPEILVLYTIAISGTIVSLWIDYRNKVKLIDQLLKSM